METQSKKIAAVYMLLSSLSFAFMQLFVKLTAGEIPLFEQIFIRNFVILWMMLFILHKNKSLDKLKIKEGKGILLIRSMSGFMGITLFFYAMRTIHLADAAALQKMSPFFVMLFSAIILKEKLTKTKLIALVTSFLGVLFIVKPAFDSGVIPSVLALFSAVFAGLAYTMIAFMKNKVHSHAIIFYFSAFCCLACIPFMIGNFVVPSPMNGFYLLLIGVMGGFGQSFLTAAYKLAPAGEVSVYNYSNIIFSAIFGLAFFGEILDNFSLVGIILIIASGIGVYVYNKE